MISRSFNRALRVPLRQQPASFSTPRRTLLTAVGNAKRGTFTTPRAAASLTHQLSRGMKTIDFAGQKETVYGKANQVLKGTVNAKFVHRAGRLATR